MSAADMAFSRFDQVIEFILAHEGGLVDDPKDPGGLTKYGISQRAYPSIDIRGLSRDDAEKIYKRDYWDKCRCDDLPPSLRLPVMDAAVNQGPDAAVRLLQKALLVKVDGVIGPKTLAAARAANVDKLLAEFTAHRFYLYGQNTNFYRFGLGWSRRVVHGFMLAARGY